MGTFFAQQLLMVEWFRDRLMSKDSEEPCWFSWVLLGVWPFMVLVGSITQWRISGRGIYHQQSKAFSSLGLGCLTKD